MKVYTKTGDKGETSLLGGGRVSKSDVRIESYGTVDELNAWIGLIRDHTENNRIRDLLEIIQDRLFIIGSLLAVEPGKMFDSLPELKEEDISLLESEMDEMDEKLPEMRNFILPGGHPLVSYTHITRAVCRRAERHIIRLDKEQKVDEAIIRYLNRLSDYLFMLARFTAQDLGVKEVRWNPGK